jgi:tartrate-resistant acid phosphatase type 5
VIGDFGDGSPNEAAVARLVKSWKPDFIITTGDDNYPVGAERTIDPHIGAFYADFIGNYHGAYGTGSRTNRFWPTPGNHDWFASRLAPYLDYFTLPGNERYYEVELGIVHLVALDSDPKEPDGMSAASVQGRWAHERLAASKACFQIVYFHHPPYSSGPHGDTASMQWPFRTWGADAVLAGHDHTYERFQIDGIPYFVNGLGGAEKYPLSEASKQGSVLRYNAKHGAMLGIASVEGLTFQFWNVDGARIDNVEVPKHCPR